MQNELIDTNEEASTTTSEATNAQIDLDGTEIQTKFGKVKVHPTGGDHVHVCGTRNDPSITVRGVPYSVSIHLYRTNDGLVAFTIRNYSDVYITRQDAKWKQPPSNNARIAIVEHLQAEVNEWIRGSGAAYLQAAEQQKREEAIASSERAVLKAEGTLREARLALEKAQADLEEFLGR